MNTIAAKRNLESKRRQCRSPQKPCRPWCILCSSEPPHNFVRWRGWRKEAPILPPVIAAPESNGPAVLQRSGPVCPFRVSSC